MTEELIDNFAFAYSIALEKIFGELTHDEDSGCNYESVGHRKTYEYNNILMLYQPKGVSEGWIEEGAIIFTLTKEAKAKGLKFDNKSLDLFKSNIDIVNQKLYESFMNFSVPRKNTWYETIETSTFLNIQDFTNQLCGITKPLNFESGVIKFNFKIKWFYIEFNIHTWNPLELINYRRSLNSQHTYESSWKAKTLNDIKLQDYFVTKEEKDDYFDTLCINNQLLKIVDEYVDDEAEYLEYFYRSGRLFIPTIQDFKIPDGKKLSGNKRKAE